jgi:hypothetical protein
MRFEDTLTEIDFRPPLSDSDDDWLAQRMGTDPDLHVDGLEQSLVARLMDLLRRERP